MEIPKTKDIGLDKLKELIEENEESFFQDEDINNISFELFNLIDLWSSNKSE